MYKIELFSKRPLAIEIVDLELAIRRNVLRLDRTQICSENFCFRMFIREVDGLRVASLVSIHAQTSQVFLKTNPYTGARPQVQHHPYITS